MRVLGLNGWGERSHDASACLLVDGEIVAFAEEERFTRRKHGFDALPLRSAAFCLAQGGIGLDDVDAVAFGWDMPRLLGSRQCAQTTVREGVAHLLPRETFPRATDPALQYVDHHVAHAASAYLHSGADRAAVLVVDGQGEDASASLYHGVDGRLELLDSYPIGWSLGYFYEAACQFVGMRTCDAGKLMGLAAHGSPSDALDGHVRLTATGYEFPQLKQSYVQIGQSDEQGPIVDTWIPLLAEAFGRPPNTGGDSYAYRHVAATVQAVLEEAVLRVARGLLARTGESVLAVAGGVGYNATLNGKLRGLPGVGRLFVQPAAGDAGVSLGAAAWVAAQSGDRVQPIEKSMAFGPAYRADAIRELLVATGARFTEPADLAADVAERLRRGQLLGWFNGRAEVGPRALGSRSLLALPGPRAQRDRVNLEAKRREWWRPLAPSVLEEAATDIFGEDLRLPFMITTVAVTDRVREDFGAVVHEDGTTRPQTVSARAQPLYHRVIAEAGDHGAVLNTSFNGRDEPIVHTPRNALDTFHGLRLDALAIGPFLVEP